MSGLLKVQSNVQDWHNIWFSFYLQQFYFGGGPVVQNTTIGLANRILYQAWKAGFQFKDPDAVTNQDYRDLVRLYWPEDVEKPTKQDLLKGFPVQHQNLMPEPDVTLYGVQTIPKGNEESAPLQLFTTLEEAQANASLSDSLVFKKPDGCWKYVPITAMSIGKTYFRQFGLMDEHGDVTLYPSMENAWRARRPTHDNVVERKVHASGEVDDWEVY